MFCRYSIKGAHLTFKTRTAPNLKTHYPSLGATKDPVLLDAGPLPSPARSSWKGFDIEVEVEATKGKPYRRPMLRAVQLSCKVCASCGGGGL